MKGTTTTNPKGWKMGNTPVKKITVNEKGKKMLIEDDNGTKWKVKFSEKVQIPL
jgi:two-component sensor histidine kinase